MEDLRYPIGTFRMPDEIKEQDQRGWIHTIKELPNTIASVTNHLSEVQLNTPYREGGWTVKQVVHHLADSHMNSFIRFKLALTEDNPTIKPYEEGKWAISTDARESQIDLSLNILSGLHARWVHLLNSMTENDFRKTFYHPEMKTSINLQTALALYAWHSEHHTAHITSLIKRLNW